MRQVLKRNGSIFLFPQLMNAILVNFRLTKELILRNRINLVSQPVHALISLEISLLPMAVLQEIVFTNSINMEKKCILSAGPTFLQDLPVLRF